MLQFQIKISPLSSQWDLFPPANCRQFYCFCLEGGGLRIAKDYGIKIKYSDLWRLSLQNIFFFFITQKRLIVKVMEELMRLIAYLMSFLCEEFQCIFVLKLYFNSVVNCINIFKKKRYLRELYFFFFYKWLKDYSVKLKKDELNVTFEECSFPFNVMFLICIFNYVEFANVDDFGGNS